MNKMTAVITQNCDGLHRKAGTSNKILFELHGNVFVEYCEKCEVSYNRY
jgi:NAD-dependent SIR2 family protein deacetylase